MVVKKNGTCAAYSRDKVLQGMITACEKRKHITLDQLTQAIEEIEAELFDSQDCEVPTQLIGEKVSEFLQGVDEVAYVRFTSVYREFADVQAFLETLKPLLQKNGAKPPVEEEVENEEHDTECSTK